MEYDERITHRVVRLYRLTAAEFNQALREFIERKTGHKLPINVQFHDHYLQSGGYGASLDKEDLWDGIYTEVEEIKKIR